MHQNFGLREAGRTLLTITGIVLLLVFGTRAASQASSMTAVRGQAKNIAALPTNISWLASIDTQPATSPRMILGQTDSRSFTNTQVSAERTNQTTLRLDNVAQKLAEKATSTADQALSTGSSKKIASEVGSLDAGKQFDKQPVK